MPAQARVNVVSSDHLRYRLDRVEPLPIEGPTEVRELTARFNAMADELATSARREAERLADHVAILAHGRLVASGTPYELTTSGRSLEDVYLDLTGRALS